MNRQEAARVLELRQHLWPHTAKADDPASEVDTWAQMLSEHSAGDVVKAMTWTSRRPGFAPSLLEVLQALDPQPSAEAVWAEFEQKLAAGYSTYRDPAGIAWSHPFVASVARAGYWRRFGDAPDPRYDEFAPANAANFRKGFLASVAHVLVQVRREALGLPSRTVEVASRPASELESVGETLETAAPARIMANEAEE